MQDMPSADGIAVNHRDNRLGQAPDLHLHVEHIQSGHTVRTYISAPALDVHVASGAESQVAGTRKYHHPYVEMVAAIGESLAHLPHRKGRESIAVAGTVDGYLGDMMIFLEEDFLEIEP